MEKLLRRHLISLVLVIGYVLMSMLVAQQSRTIESQRTLIKQLFKDSLELNAMKIQKVQAAAHR